MSDDKEIGSTEGSAQVPPGDKSSSEGGAEVEGSEGQEKEGSQRPSRARARIEQLSRENRRYRDAINKLESRFEELEASFRGRSDSEGSRQPGFYGEETGSARVDIRSHVDERVNRVLLERETQEAKAFLRGQEGFDPSVDWDEFERIAEENGWDDLSNRQPMRAARLIAKVWRKEKGLDKPVDKSKAAGVRGSAPQPVRTSSMDELGRKAREMISSGEIPLRAKNANDEIRKLFAEMRKSSG